MNTLPVDLRNYRAERPWHEGIPFLMACVGSAGLGYAVIVALLSLA